MAGKEVNGLASDDTDELRRAALYLTGAFAGWRRRRAAQRLARTGTAAGARCLAEVFLDSADERVTEIARQALAGLADADREAWDAVCEVAIVTGEPRLAEIVNQSGRLPSNHERRALWLFLDRQYDRAAELDFDGRLLRAAHTTAGPELRRRIAEHARAAGRVEWIRPLASRRDLTGLTDLTAGEWDDALAVLTAGQRWDQLWRLAPLAPLPSSVQILRRLREANWLPPGDRDRYAHLLELAHRCRSPLSAGALFPQPLELARTVTQLKAHAISRRGDLLAAAQRIGPPAVRLWHLPSGEPAGELGNTRSKLAAGSVAITPDGSTVAAGDYIGRVLLWSTTTGQETGSLKVGTWDSMVALTFTPDGELLIGGSNKGKLFVWQLSSGRLLHKVDMPRGIPSLAMTPDGRHLAVGSRDEYWHLHGSHSKVRLFRLPAMEPAGVIEVGRSGVRSLPLTPDGRLLVAVGVDGTTNVWRLPSCAPVAAMGYEASLSRVALSADGTLLAGVNRASNAIEVRRPHSGDLVTTTDAGPLGVDGRSGIGRFAVSPDGRHLLGADNLEGPTRVWHLPSGELAGDLPGSSDGAQVLTFAPNGAAIVGASQGPGTIRMWQPEPALSGAVPLAQVTPDALQQVRRRSFSPDDLRWLELADALVWWRHRNDIALADAHESPTTSDIELTE